MLVKTMYKFYQVSLINIFTFDNIISVKHCKRQALQGDPVASVLININGKSLGHKSAN